MDKSRKRDKRKLLLTEELKGCTSKLLSLVYIIHKDLLVYYLYIYYGQFMKQTNSNNKNMISVSIERDRKKYYEKATYILTAEIGYLLRVLFASSPVVTIGTKMLPSVCEVQKHVHVVMTCSGVWTIWRERQTS